MPGKSWLRQEPQMCRSLCEGEGRQRRCRRLRSSGFGQWENHHFLKITQAFFVGSLKGFRTRNLLLTLSGWCFGTMEFYDFPLGISSSWLTHIFQRGRSTTNQLLAFSRKGIPKDPQQKKSGHESYTSVGISMGFQNSSLILLGLLWGLSIKQIWDSSLVHEGWLGWWVNLGFFLGDFLGTVWRRTIGIFMHTSQYHGTFHGSFVKCQVRCLRNDFFNEIPIGETGIRLGEPSDFFLNGFDGLTFFSARISHVW